MKNFSSNKIIRVATHSGSLENLLRGQLRFMSSYYDMFGVASKGERINGRTTIERFAESENVKVFPVEMTREITPLKDFKALYQLYKIFKKEKPLIVHSHTPKAGTLAMIAARVARVPFRMHTVAGLPLVEATGIKRRILDAVEKITYACATKIYPNSYGLRDIIIDNNFTKPKKMKIIGSGSSNGIDTAYFDPSRLDSSSKLKLRKELSIEESDFVFIFLGRIVKDKGINELVTAFKKLTVNHHQAKLLLVGYYNVYTAKLSIETIREIKNNEHIILVDWQDDVRPYLGISNVLTFPSYREGFPNVVLQASAMEVPSIVCEINGCNEIINNGVNGIVIPVKNIISLQNSMTKLMEDQDFYNYLVKNTRAPIRKKFERIHIWKSLLSEYNACSKSAQYVLFILVQLVFTGYKSVF